MSSGKDAPSYATIVAPERPATQKQSSWLEECLQNEETPAVPAQVPATAPVEKKRSATSTNEPNDPTDNSSEVDDNGDFVPVLSHNSRKERKIRRKEKQQQTTALAGPKGGRKGANGSSGEGTPVSGEQKKKSSRRQRGDRKTPRKEKEPLVNGKDSNTDNGNESSGNASETKTDEQAEKPVKYVAAPPPKVNAWKVSVLITIC